MQLALLNVVNFKWTGKRYLLNQNELIGILANEK